MKAMLVWKMGEIEEDGPRKRRLFVFIIYVRIHNYPIYPSEDGTFSDREQDKMTRCSNEFCVMATCELFKDSLG